MELLSNFARVKGGVAAYVARSRLRCLILNIAHLYFLLSIEGLGRRIVMGSDLFEGVHYFVVEDKVKDLVNVSWG